MIQLTTGTPGAGKTLLTIYEVEQRRQKETRDVYYNGIKALNLPWIELEDASKWDDLPIGSIIVLDECQTLFRPRFSGSKVPEYVQALETHRHKGYDIYLITQHPTLIETNVRRLVEQHKHIMRKFGSSWATVHTWKGVKENCDKSRADSIREEWKYPREVYGWYKSAEVHTHKLRIPPKILLAFMLPVALALGAWYFYKNRLAADINKAQTPQANSGQVQQNSFPQNVTQSSKNSLPVAQSKPPVATVAEYLAQFNPRLTGLPWTAPRYDDLTQPQQVPTIRGCVIQTANKEQPEAWCMLDGGVRIYPPRSFIEAFLKDRFFIDWESNGRGGDYAAAQPRNGDRALGQNRPPINNAQFTQ